MPSKNEQETIISFDEAGKTANVYTFNAARKRKLDALAENRSDECRFIRINSDGGADYKVPKKWIRVSASRILTDEQRAALAASAGRMNAQNRF